MSLKYITNLTVSSVEWIRNTITFNRELNDLNRMTDVELRDIGLSRCDVSALAKNLRNHPVGL